MRNGISPLYIPSNNTFTFLLVPDLMADPAEDIALAAR